MTYRSVCANLAPDADAAEFRLLGEGVWGCVVDLADGTVMKLIRRDGGLGDGLELWTNETRALTALEACTLPCAVPQLISCGRLDDSDAAGTSVYLAWIRMSRLEGTALDDDQMEELSPAAREQLGDELGTALAVVHGIQTTAAFDNPRAGVDTSYLNDIKGEIDDVADPGIMAVLRASLGELASGAGTVPNHGDINTTNILVDTAGHLSGLVDWAEARLDWPEAEFCHLRCFPEFLAPVRAAYEAFRKVRLDDRRLDIAALHNALITVAIARRLGDGEEEAWGREWVARLRASVIDTKD